MTEKEVLIDWIKKHKKELTLAGVGVSGIAVPTISTNWDDMSILETMDFNMQKVEANSIDVGSHIRTLPEGWTPSAEKIASAVQMGYELNPNQTWVEQYTKRIIVA